MMKDTDSKLKNKDQKTQNKLKLNLPENKLIKIKTSKKKLLKTENENRQIKSKFYNKLELLRDKEVSDLNKEGSYKKCFSYNFDKKIIQNSVSQNLITKILEINNTESSLKNDSSKFFLYQKEDNFSTTINTTKLNRISNNHNQKIIDYKDESKITIKKNANNKTQEKLQHIKNKNSKQDVSKNKNIINTFCKSGTQDFRKFKNIKFDSSSSFFDHLSENDFKYNSTITDNLRSHLKKTDILFGSNKIKGSNSNQQLTFRIFSQNNLTNIPISQRSNLKNNNNKIISKIQKEIAQSIMELDLVKLQKEVYEYENTDVTDAINRLPTHKFTNKFDSNKNKNNNKNNKHIK